VADIPLRYLSKVYVNDTGCWIWHGATINSGYGCINYLGARRPAHRVFWSIFNNTNVDSIGDIMHSCDNRLCVNPQHLKLGTRQENLADMNAKGRGVKGRPSKVRGSKHKLAKLTEATALKIKKAGSYSEAVQLGIDFGVSKSTARRVYYGSLWAWL